MFLLSALLSAAAAAPAAGQTYVGASLVADIARFSHAEIDGQAAGAGGEAPGFALRVGTGIGSAWGVELEFARPAVIEENRSSVVIPLVLAEVSRTAGGILPPAAIAGIPSIAYELQTEIRNTTLSAMAWARQDVSARVTLVYLGGVGFFRSEASVDVGFRGPAPLPVGSVLPPFRSATVRYGAKPAAGFEARIGFTERAQLVPGIRIQGLEDGWLIRPSVGVSWTF